VNLLEEPLRKSSCATLHLQDYFSAPVRLPGSTGCALITIPRSSLLPVLIFSLHSTGLLDYHLSIWGHQSFKVVDAVYTLSPGCMRMETIQPEPYRREGGVATRSHNRERQSVARIALPKRLPMKTMSRSNAAMCSNCLQVMNGSKRAVKSLELDPTAYLLGTPFSHGASRPENQVYTFYLQRLFLDIRSSTTD
jgi:hypothetical protein